MAVEREDDAIGLALLSPWPGVWTRGQVLHIELLVSVGDQPAEGALWEWGFMTPGSLTLYRQPDVTLGQDGIWSVEVPLALDLPVGVYTIYGRGSWYAKSTGVVSGQLTLQ